MPPSPSPPFLPLASYASPPFLPDLPSFLASHLFLLVSYYYRLILIRRPDGQVFEVPPENSPADLQLKRGDVVTFTYDSLYRGSTPVNPTIYRIRTDLSWREILFEASGEKNTDFGESDAAPEPPSHSQVLNSTTKKKGGGGAVLRLYL